MKTQLYSRIPRIRRQQELARLWDGVRLAMHERQFPSQPNERIRRFQLLVEQYAPQKGKITLAAVGTGNPELIGMEALPKPLLGRLQFSDGGLWMRELCEENYPALKDKVRLVFWDQLPEAYGKRKLAAVFITGASLGYVVSWDEEKLHERAIEALKSSIMQIGSALRKDGKFFFDLPKTTNENMRLGPGSYEGERVEYYLNAESDVDETHNFTFRTATFGVTGGYFQSFTRHGIHLDVEIMNQLLAGADLSEAKEIPKDLQLDPLYYQLYYAEKKRKFWQIF